MVSLASENMTSRLFMENYNILQNCPESMDSRTSHNYHCIDLVTTTVNKPNFEKFMLALNIDRSGSMGSRDKTGKTPLDYTLHTVKTLINYLEDIKKENPEIVLKVLVNAFDDKQCNIGLHEIGKSSEEYLKKISSIFPRGTTNIEGAFETILNQDAYQYFDEKAHILFTDGQPNVGKQSARGITEKSPGGKQIYVGYGAGHDSKLLQDMSKIVNGDYHFVDNIENAGMVYGEIIHSLLFASVKDINVKIKGAEVYDFKNNIWTDNIKFNSFSSEHKQTLILRSEWNSVEPINVNVIYSELNNNTHSKTDIYSKYNCTNGESKESQRNILVEKQIYRQKTMELLSNTLNFQYDDTELFKESLIKFEKDMKTFMNNKNLNDDSFMLKLCTDIYIAFTGIHSTVGNAFINSRLTSQGHQRAFEVSDLSNLRQPTISSPSYRRFRSDSFEENSSPKNVENTAMSPPSSFRQTSCYATPSQQRVMRSLSQPIDND